MIVKAVSVLPLCVTANTGFVGLRVPRHNLARKLLEECQLPIAAPSANRFGHVSPTKASHVFDDLGVGRGVSAIISSEDEVACQHGIESTVIKADLSSREIHVYRQGAVTLQALEAVVGCSDHLARLGDIRWTLRVVSRTVQMGSGPEDTPAAVGQEAPGQAITHYAPDNAVCMMASVVHIPDAAPGAAASSIPPTPGMLQWVLSRDDLRHTAIIDFRGQWGRLLGQTTPQPQSDSPTAPLSVLAYRDLSPGGSYEEAAFRLFDTLRWAETVPDLRFILVTPVLSDVEFVRGAGAGVPPTPTPTPTAGPADGDIKWGIHDRLFRSTSGKIVQLTVV